MTTPAGWYDDGSGTQRYWDGIQWTTETRVQPPPPYVPPSPPGRQEVVWPVLLLRRPWFTAAGVAAIIVVVVVVVLVVSVGSNSSSDSYSKNELLNAYDSCFNQWEIATSNGTLPPLDPSVGPTS